MKSFACRTCIPVLALLLCGGIAIAQEFEPAPLPPPPVMEGEFHTTRFLALTDVNDKVVTGAPYSAQAVTETSQTLSDGNQIIRKETSQIYRDSQGRTRREGDFTKLGPWAATGAPHQMVTINDPVASVHYMLNPERKTAVKMPRGPGRHNGKFLKRWAARREQEAQSTSESLGTQVIEGITAEGTRVTETIPAGQIGNVRPITIVAERWYSPQLQIFLLTKRSDPRFGETIYRLTNISTAEPAPELFQVPPDYAIKEGRGVFQRPVGVTVGPPPE